MESHAGHGNRPALATLTPALSLQRESEPRSPRPRRARGPLRAILKASNLCALEPNQIAHKLVDRGVTKSYSLAQGTDWRFFSELKKELKG